MHVNMNVYTYIHGDTMFLMILSKVTAIFLFTIPWALDCKVAKEMEEFYSYTADSS